jgi:hypothetical protein
VFQTGSVRWLAPIDPDGGGTWISVNELGITLCLLNGNGAPRSQSRGTIIRSLAAISAQQDLIQELDRLPLTSYAPFVIAALAPGLAPVVTEWNGSRLAVHPDADALLPLVSSSLDPESARRERTELFRVMRPRSVKDLIRFHRSHWPQPGPLSPCMHRSDAATVSFTHVCVTPDSIRMDYYPGPLCHDPEPATVTLNAPCFLNRAIHARQ